MVEYVEKIDLYLFISSVVIASASAIYTYITSRSTANQKVIEETEVRVSEQGQRLERMLAELDSLSKLSELPLILERDYLKKSDMPDRSAALDNAKKLAVLEAEMKELNLSGVIASINNRINEVVQSSASQAGELKQINSTLLLIQKHLMGR